MAANSSVKTCGRVSSDGPVSKVNPSRRYSPSFPPWVAARSCSSTRCPCAASRAAAASPPTPAPIDDDPRHVSPARTPARGRPSRRRPFHVSSPRRCPRHDAASNPSSAATDAGCASASGQARPPLRRAASTRLATAAAVADEAGPGAAQRGQRAAPRRPGRASRRPPRTRARGRTPPTATCGSPALRSAQPSYIRQAASPAPSATPTRPPARLTARATARSSSTSAPTPANPPARASAAASTTRNCPFAAHSAGLRRPLGPAQRQRHHPRPLQQRLHQPGRGAVGELARPRREQVEPGAPQHRDRRRDGVRGQHHVGVDEHQHAPPRRRPRAGRRRAACPAAPVAAGCRAAPAAAGRPRRRRGRRPRCRRSSRRRGRAPPGRGRRAGPAPAASAGSTRCASSRTGMATVTGSVDGRRRGGRDAQRAEVDAAGAACRPRRAPAPTRTDGRPGRGHRRRGGGPGERDGGGPGRIEASRRA